MSGRTFYPNPDTYEQPPTVAERADDERYANAVNALACVFRVDIEQARRATGSDIAAFNACSNIRTSAS